jgi:hypothetical protein
VLARSDNPVAGPHVWEHNNLAQKNLTVVDLAPNDWIVLPFVLANANPRGSQRFVIELVRPKTRVKMAASLLHGTGKPFNGIPGINPLRTSSFPTRQAKGTHKSARRVDCGAGTLQHVTLATANDAGRMLTSFNPNAASARHFTEAVQVLFAPGRLAQIPVALSRHEQLVMGLRLELPQGARIGEALRLDLVQRDRSGNRILGGLAIEIHVARRLKQARSGRSRSTRDPDDSAVAKS